MKKVIIINFFIITAIIFILEIIIRALNIVELQGYNKKAFFQENKIILSKADKTFIVSGKKVKTDKNGFRIPLKDFTFEEGNNSYLILGDSVTYGVGIEEKFTFIGILRKKFNNKNFLNTAIFGHNLKSYSYLLKKNHQLFENKIDKVIIFLCLNDIVPYQGVVFNNKIQKTKKNKSFVENYLKNNMTFELNVFLRERSAIFVLLKSLFTKPVKRHYHYMYKLYEDNNNLIESESHIKEIKKYSKENNINLEFVLLPYAHQVMNNCEEKFLKPQNEMIKIFAKHDLIIKDYTQKFCSIFNKNELFLPYDPVHLSKYGHRNVSDLLIADKIFN